jgi:hypothetical protein
MYTNTTGEDNVAVGHSALYYNTTAGFNTAVGKNALLSNTTATHNVAVGYSALYSVTTQGDNTAVGNYALYSNTGARNVAMGYTALYANTSGVDNVSLGMTSLRFNTTGSSNTAVGREALRGNTTATRNTALGYQAGYNNTTGYGGVFVGYKAGYSSVTSNLNTMVGDNAGVDTTGAQNTFIGQGAGASTTTGAKNTIIGRYNGNQGGLDIRTSSNRVVLSDGDGNWRSHFNNSTTFAYRSLGSVVLNRYYASDGTTEVGSLTFNASFGPAASTDSLLLGNGGGDMHIAAQSNGVYLTNGATSWTAVSDERNKDIIEPISDAANKVSQLRTVIGKYKTDEEGTRRAFLIAQDVQTVLPEAVTVDTDEDATLGVAYTDIIPLLAAAIKEQQATITALEARIAALES